MIRIMFFSIVAILILSSSAEAQVYKCTNNAGKVEFGQTPCENSGSKEEVISLPNKGGSSIPIYPGATLKTKDVGDGYMDYFEYKSTDDFNQVIQFYTKSAGENNCEKRFDYQTNCKYKKVPGYKYAEVAVAKEDGWVLIILTKTIK